MPPTMTLMNENSEIRNVRGDIGALLTELSNYYNLTVVWDDDEWFGYDEDKGIVWIALECPKAFKECHTFSIFMDCNGDIKYSIIKDDGTELIDGAYDDLYKAYKESLDDKVDEDDIETLKTLVEKYGIDCVKGIVECITPFNMPRRN